MQKHAEPVSSTVQRRSVTLGVIGSSDEILLLVFAGSVTSLPRLPVKVSQLRESGDWVIESGSGLIYELFEERVVLSCNVFKVGLSLFTLLL